MKILLVGEYSNVHWTLAQGLRALGHEVTVVSDGDGWKGYERDIDLSRRSLGFWDSLRYVWKAKRTIGKLRGYDVVQLINPVFLDLRAERILPFYRQLRRNNGKMFLGAFGMDKFWVKVCLDCQTFRYSDFNLGSEVRHSAYNDTVIADWLNGPKGRLNDLIAEDCDGIVSGLYEYEMCYRPFFRDKLRYIPFPIQLQPVEPRPTEFPLRFFIGIQPARSAYKGTDIMLRALERLERDYPSHVKVVKAENVPFHQYQRLVSSSDILLDQLYSYTPAMNGLLAMSRGLVLVGGGEEEHYDLLGEKELRPIVNVLPDEENVYQHLKTVAFLPLAEIDRLKAESIEYVRRHHDYVKVAQQYLDFWNTSAR